MITAPLWYLVGLAVLLLLGLGLTAWLLLLKVDRAAGLGVLALALVASSAHAQVQCKSGNVKCPPGSNTIPCSWLDPSACASGGGGGSTSCTECNHAASADSALTAGTANQAATLTGSISGTQVTTCPTPCASSGGGTSPIKDDGVYLVAPKPFEVYAPGGSGDDTATSLTQRDVASRFLWAGRDATLYQGGVAGASLRRNRAVRVGERYNGANGDVYEVTVAGTTAAARPVKCPVVRLPLQNLPANQYVYPGWGGGSVPGAIYRVTNASGCTTARDSRVSWCSTNGCTTVDGSCSFVREALGSSTFTDGTATLKLGWIDPYGGVEVAQVGQSTPNGPTFAAQVSDNQEGMYLLTTPQMRVDRYMQSNATVGTNWRMTMGAGDRRAGTFEHEFKPEAGGAQTFRIATGDPLGPPEVPPTVSLVAGGSFPVGQETAWSVAYEDKRLDMPTAVHTRAARITPTAGMQAVKICYPGFPEHGGGWPQPAGSDGKNRTRVLIYNGDRGWWTTFVGVLESPDECITIRGDADVMENQTGSDVDRNGLPILEVNDTNIYRQQWLPGMDVIRMRTQVRAPVENGHSYIAGAIGCTSPCANCDYNRDRHGRTGATPPAPALWDSGNRVPDGDVCWLRRSFDYAPALIVGQLCFAELGANGLHVGYCIGPRGVQQYDLAADNPLAKPLTR